MSTICNPTWACHLILEQIGGSIFFEIICNPLYVRVSPAACVLKCQHIPATHIEEIGGSDGSRIGVSRWLRQGVETDSNQQF